ncbi:penicillin-binding protein PBP2X [Streptococcus sp. S784/96/1]|uniref:penicillin-binding protein PBP2X n=1 Tax=Streptococcus sp. S784/96/1 TaxID=2653499 RepID=UPI001386AFA7|nr:penicillin-binding protein PBP2X [Streptococcus sp. S784/96/1]
MKKLIQLFLSYAVEERKTPMTNRKRVGQNLMILSIFVFFVFLINFAIIIGTDSKFGIDLSEGAAQVYQLQVTQQAKRGTIYDRHGNVIAEDSTTYSVYAVMDTSYVDVYGNKLYVKKSQFKKVADIFHEYLGMEKNYVINQLEQEKLSQTAFGIEGNNLNYSTMSAVAEAVKKAGIKGIDFYTNPGRMYPNGTFASHFIGLAQLVEDEKTGSKSFTGTMGMEFALNEELSGTDGIISYQKDKNGNVLLGSSTPVKAAINGKDIYTTLSQPLQVTLETQLDLLAEKTLAKHISATLVNAKTGEILATSQRPTYNADTLEGLDEKKIGTWNSLLYQGNYEPGSTMKVFTLASSIDNGTFNPNQTYYSDKYELADAVIKDWDVNMGLSDGNYLTLSQGFAYSSNVGILHLQQGIGTDKWMNYLSKFRFGTRTRFGMSDEAVGNLPEDNLVTIAQSAFGQGINVTQIQMLRAFTSISNNGVMLEPHFIGQIYDPNTESSRTVGPEIIGNPISSEAATETRQYMVTVGTDPIWGTLYSKTLGSPVIQVGNESIAVKSGTAQIAASAEEGGGYLQGSNDTINSVIAMIPSDDPMFMMYVTIQQPEVWTGLEYRDIFNPVLEEALLMERELTQPIQPIGDKKMVYKMPNIVGKSSGNSADMLRRNIVQPVIVGEGEKIIKTSVEKGDKVPENAQILLLTDSLKKVPDLYGWTKKNVDIFAEWQGWTVNYKGSGNKVVKQSVDVGEDISKLDKITITLGE